MCSGGWSLTSAAARRNRAQSCGLKRSGSKACKAAGCPGRIPHDLRRTAVRNLVRAGIPQTVAMSLTGHRTDSVFRRYDIVSAIDLKDAARRLDQVAQMRQAK
jgi:integrase